MTDRSPSEDPANEKAHEAAAEKVDEPQAEAASEPEAVAAAEGENAGETEVQLDMDDPELRVLVDAMRTGEPVEGKVIGWNRGGFHIVLGSKSAFCPRSEMEVARPKAPKSYLDRTFPFAVLRIEENGRRVVLSRVQILRREKAARREKLRAKLTPGTVLSGRVASITDFGAFVDLGGVQGLVHISEISRQRVERAADRLKVGQRVRVHVLKVEQGGRRISLSMKRLEPDPWEGIAQRFEAGSVVKGTVEKTAPFGAFVVLEPGLTGLLPSSALALPRGSSLARMFPPGKEVSVQILNVDARRRRISLALEGSSVEGSRADFESYRKTQRRDQSRGGFNALAAALEKARRVSD